MKPSRMEAFSDGVIAIIITIMVLGLQPPHGHDLHALRPLIPTFLTYVLSFVYLGIYWNNHHHLIRATNKVTGVILWANLHLLFWLTLFPFFTSWIGSTHFAVIPVLCNSSSCEARVKTLFCVMLSVRTLKANFRSSSIPLEFW
jgi:uncharacterized membrane protein